MRAFLTADSDGTVVVLGEGPGTQFWRVDLLMYLPPRVQELIGRCAARFRGGAMVFDTVPKFTSPANPSHGCATPGGNMPPHMPWGSPSRLVDGFHADPHVIAARLADSPTTGRCADLLAVPHACPGIVRLDFTKDN